MVTAQTFYLEDGEQDMPSQRFRKYLRVTAQTFYLEDGEPYTDLVVGEGLTRVAIGVSGANKPGFELIIGGSQINQYLNDVLTLADVAQLRDNLNALLADPRLQAEQEAFA